MGYRQIGTNKKGEKKWLITIELGKDVFGDRDRKFETFCGTLAEVKIRDAELTKQYYRKGNVANVKDLTFEFVGCSISIPKNLLISINAFSGESDAWITLADSFSRSP